MQPEKILGGVWILGVSIDFGRIFMYFKAFIAGRDSFYSEEFELGNLPK